MRLTFRIQRHIRIKFLLVACMLSSVGQWYVLNINTAWATESNTNFSEQDATLNLIQKSIKEFDSTQKQAKLLQVKNHSNNIRDISPLLSQLRQKKLNQSATDNSQKIQIFVQETSDQEDYSSELNEEEELRLRVRPKPFKKTPPPAKAKPRVQFKPIGYLRGYAGYFQSSNIFSANENKIADGLLYSGLTLASAYFPLSRTTYLNGSINGSLIHYLDQSQFDYNQIRFKIGIYQQLSRKMYSELNFSNRQLFYAKNSDFFAAGDRFLNENSVELSLGRRDKLTDKLIFDSLYEFRVNFSDPSRRSRIANSLSLSLSYYLQKPLQVGINYQVNLSDFTERDREDNFHRLFGHLNYRTSPTSNIYLQGGLNFGGSTNPNLDFSSWSFSINYGFEIDRF